MLLQVNMQLGQMEEKGPTHYFRVILDQFILPLLAL